MPAMVIAVWVGRGGTVAAGLPLIVLEAKKMQLMVLALGNRVVAEVQVQKGEQVATGQVPAVMKTVDTETVDTETVDTEMEAKGDAS
jgi:propionyl-CoA carboxylase alpha chain